MGCRRLFPEERMASDGDNGRKIDGRKMSVRIILSESRSVTICMNLKL